MVYGHVLSDNVSERFSLLDATRKAISGACKLVSFPKSLIEILVSCHRPSSWVVIWFHISKCSQKLYGDCQIAISTQSFKPWPLSAPVKHRRTC